MTRDREEWIEERVNIFTFHAKDDVRRFARDAMQFADAHRVVHREAGVMRVAINVCFGGFSLSRKAVKRLAELNGRECYFFTHDVKNLDRYIPSNEEPREGCDLFWCAFDIPNPNEVLRSSKSWYEMDDAEKKASNALYERHSLPNGRDISRHDPLLLQVINELGKDANGGCANLKIVDIPDGIEYVIEEYDGNEHIAEVHRTWR